MTVSEVVRNIEYPERYIKLNDFNFTKIVSKDNKLVYPIENLHSTEIGLAVDYMTRFMQGFPKHEVFELSMLGAERFRREKVYDGIRFMDEMYNYLNNIQGLDDISIISACNLVRYDVCYRNMPSDYAEYTLHPDDDTIDNIRTMVLRSLNFLDAFGPAVVSGGILRSNRAKYIRSGRYDYATVDCLYDFKVLTYSPEPVHLLQILVYYLLGKNEGYNEFRTINKIGLYNPRCDEIFTLQVNKIRPEVINSIERDVIGY